MKSCPGLLLQNCLECAKSCKRKFDVAIFNVAFMLQKKMCLM